VTRHAQVVTVREPRDGRPTETDALSRLVVRVHAERGLPVPATAPQPAPCAAFGTQLSLLASEVR